jgi:hypothetical protein
MIVPPARAIARSYPGIGAGDASEGYLLAVAEGAGDPDSAEAQAAEALNRLEAAAARRRAGTPAVEVLSNAIDAADQGVRRLLRLPGSEAAAGVTLGAALVEGRQATLVVAGPAGAFLVRGGSARALAVADPRVASTARLGHTAPGDVQPAGPVDIQDGDTLILCTAGVARGLGGRVVGAVIGEYGVELAGQELTDLAVQQGNDGAAVAFVHFPDSPTTAPLVVPPTRPQVPRPRWLAPAIVAAAVLVGALAALGVLLVAARSGGSKHPTPSTALSTARATAGPPVLLATATPARSAQGLSTATVALASPAPARSPGPQATAVASPTPAAQAGPVASATPVVASALPACGAGTAPPCRYTAQPGDSLSRIGDRFDLTRACFEAANRSHTPDPPTQGNNDLIRVNEEYVILDPAGCSALLGGAASPQATTAPAAAPPATPRPACTPRPGATTPPPDC